MTVRNTKGREGLLASDTKYVTQMVGRGCWLVTVRNTKGREGLLASDNT